MSKRREDHLTIRSSRDCKLESRLIAPCELEIAVLSERLSVGAGHWDEAVVKDEPRTIRGSDVLWLNANIQTSLGLVRDIEYKISDISTEDVARRTSDCEICVDLVERFGDIRSFVAGTCLRIRRGRVKDCGSDVWKYLLLSCVHQSARFFTAESVIVSTHLYKTSATL